MKNVVKIQRKKTFSVNMRSVFIRVSAVLCVHFCRGMLIVASDGGSCQCSLSTVNSASQICQCISVCALRFYCEDCAKCFKEKDYFGRHKVSAHQGQCSFVCAGLKRLCSVIASVGGSCQCSLLSTLPPGSASAFLWVP